MKLTLFFAAFLLALFVITPNPVWADRPIISSWSDAWHQPRAKILVHNSVDLGRGFERRFHVAVPNAFDHLSCVAYAGLNMQRSKSFAIEPAIGWDFENREIIASMRWSTKSYYRFHWANFEYRPKSDKIYAFVQSQRILSPGFDYGVELEGWDKPNSLGSWGFGPNARFHLRAARHHEAKLDIDLALHYRQLAGEWKPELFVRFHLTPKLGGF
jgi:hypothetical protein